MHCFSLQSAVKRYLEEPRSLASDAIRAAPGLLKIGREEVCVFERNNMHVRWTNDIK